MTDGGPQTELTILIPFHHEETTITKVLHKLHRTLTIAHEVLLIHDDQDDPTIPIIKNIQKEYPSIQIVRNTHKPGVPGALKTGLEKSRGENILLLVADDEGPVLIINPMLDLIRKGYDLVSATRYAQGGVSVGGNWWGRFFSAYGNRLFRILTASQLSDTSCGIKMFQKKILQKIQLKANSDWTIVFELAVLAQYYDFKVTELPLISHNRPDGGTSHYKIIPRILIYGKIFSWGIMKLWARKLHV